MLPTTIALDLLRDALLERLGDSRDIEGSWRDDWNDEFRSGISDSSLRLDAMMSLLAHVVPNGLVDYATVFESPSSIHDRSSIGMAIYALVADLRTASDVLMSSIKRFGVLEHSANGIVCNFAFHYLCASDADLRNILTLISNLIDPAGSFIFTVLDGGKVFEKLSSLSKGQSWDVIENGVPKYTIRKDYDDAELKGVGQMISVRLPFSDAMYPEPLCNISHVVDVGRELGLVEVSVDGRSMSRYKERFEADAKEIYAQLTSDDWEYVGMHAAVVMKKI